MSIHDVRYDRMCETFSLPEVEGSSTWLAPATVLQGFEILKSMVSQRILELRDRILDGWVMTFSSGNDEQEILELYFCIVEYCKLQRIKIKCDDILNENVVNI